MSKKLPLLFICLTILATLAFWVPDAGAFSNFAPTMCDQCHTGFAGGSGSTAHAGHLGVGLACTDCHIVIGDDPPLANCTQCHLQAGLVAHHENAGVGPVPSCATCHPGLIPDPENTMPPGYAGRGLDPCDGSEELFASLTVSLDNDGDLLYDSADPDCGPAAECGNGVVEPPEECDGGQCCEADCTFSAGGTGCDDGLFCTATDACDGAGTCTGSGTPCAPGETCDEGANSCIPAGACTDDCDCDDGLFCNGFEKCVGGSCTAGTPPCVVGLECDEAAKMCNRPVGACTSDADCDDGAFCNGVETCVGGSCQDGPDPCAPGETCDEQNNVCLECINDADCDDGLFCNGEEACVGNQCQSGTPVTCPPGQNCDEGQDMCVTPPPDKHFSPNEDCTFCHRVANNDVRIIHNQNCTLCHGTTFTIPPFDTDCLNCHTTGAPHAESCKLCHSDKNFSDYIGWNKYIHSKHYDNVLCGYCHIPPPALDPANRQDCAKMCHDSGGWKYSSSDYQDIHKRHVNRLDTNPNPCYWCHGTEAVPQRPSNICDLCHNNRSGDANTAHEKHAEDFDCTACHESVFGFQDVREVGRDQICTFCHNPRSDSAQQVHDEHALGKAQCYVCHGDSDVYATHRGEKDCSICHGSRWGSFTRVHKKHPGETVMCAVCHTVVPVDVEGVEGM